jgi:hypothetical protein
MKQRLKVIGRWKLPMFKSKSIRLEVSVIQNCSKLLIIMQGKSICSRTTLSNYYDLLYQITKDT